MVLNSFTFIQIFVVHLTLLTATSAGIKCPGYCTRNLLSCRGKGGKIIGYCTNSLACCDPIVGVTGSCSDNQFFNKNAQQTVFFKSPDFPEFSKGDLNCEFNVKLLNDTVGIRIEFIKAEMDGMSYLRSEADGGNCESDMLFFRGFGSWSPPPLCGNLTGYISILDKFSEISKDLKTLTVVALMSSLNYRWHIKIRQISKQQYYKNETINTTQKAILDYEDISIMEEDKPSYRYRRSENERVTEESLESITTSREELSDTINGEENVDSLTTPDISTSTAKTLFSTTNKPEQDSKKNVPLDQYKEKNDNEKPEHRFEIPLIVNGQDTEVIEVPWQVSIRVKANSTKAKLKSISENERQPSAIQPDVEFNEIDSNKTQLDLDESIRLNVTEFDFISNKSTVEQENDNNCSESEGFHFCGGIFLGGKFILSAAHCFFGNTKSEGMTDISTIEVVLGDTNLCTDESKQEILPSYSYDVENILIHYAYDPHLLINDIAILKLKQDVTIADNVRPVNLAEIGANFTDYKALVSGWGDTNLTSSDDSSPSILQSSMHFRIQNQSFCNEKDLEQYTDTKEAILKHPKYRYVFESTLCTKGTKDNKTFEISSGKGDSGGGLIVFDDFGEPILAGIVSYGVMSSSTRDKRTENSGENDKYESEDGATLDYFTSVSFYRKWIELAMI